MSRPSDLVVFAGPTLHDTKRGDLPDASYRPPASQGDVYSAVKDRPWAIGIIDGYFERVPAVWHKEILWAMSQGVRVYGSASIGALRAAELHQFGMRGLGSVFQWFAQGILEDDDEVTIVHASAELAYMPMSEAMVNIRATLDAAVAAAVLRDESAARLCASAKALFYPERTFARICDEGRRAGVPTSDLQALQTWLPQGRVNVKQLDALAMLDAMARDRVCEGEIRESVSYRFQHTDAWDRVVRQIDRRSLSSGVGTETYQHDAVLDELRLDPGAFMAIRTEALIRIMALELSRGDGGDVGDDAITVEVETLRRRHGLETPEKVQAWLERQGLAVETFTDLVTDEARVRRIREVLSGRLHGVIADLLRLSGRQHDLVERAEAKHAALARRGLENPTARDAGITDEELWIWFFETRLRRPVPADMAAEAAALDYLDVHAMRRNVLREYVFERYVTNPNQSGVP